MTKAERILDRFNKEYEFIYKAEKNGRYVAGYDEALSIGDKILADAQNSELVREVIQLRQDLFTSDREVAAFGFAFVEEVMG